MWHDARRAVPWAALGCALIFAAPAVGAEITKRQWLDAVAVAGIPSEVLFAVSLQESGTTMNGRREFAPWPWTLNISEAGHYFRTHDEALAALEREIGANNRRVAVGMFQIHLRFNGHRVDDVRTLLDPATNLRIAAKVLRDCGVKYEALADRLSCYYSGDVDAAGEAYARQVLARAARYGAPFVIGGQPGIVMKMPTRVRARPLPPADAAVAEASFESVRARLRTSAATAGRVIVVAAVHGEGP
jgi:hypothetical protein